MTASFSVYMIQNQINGKVYIGKATSAQLRRNAHKSRSHNVHLRHAIAKYGWGSFSFDVIEQHASEAEVFEAERFHIAYLRGLGATLYNLSDGGEGPAGVKKTEAQKQHLRDLNVGEKNRFFGKTHTPETRTRISELASKRTYGASTRSKVAEVTRKRWQDPVEYEKMVRRGAQHGMAKLTEDQVRQIRTLAPDHKNPELARMFGVSIPTIKRVKRGTSWKEIK